MTLLQKVQFLYQERLHDLTKWGRDFISDMFNHLDGVGESASDDEVAEVLTRPQIEKINELWEELGL